jgi:ABC-type amino acid transport substrate-binding protein
MQLAAVLLSLLPWSARAAAEEVRFAVDTFPPYVELENDRLVGPAIDIIERSARKAGLNPVIVNLPIKRGLSEMLAGRIDVVLSATPAELAAELVASKPISTDGISVIWRSGSPSPTDLAGLAGSQIIVLYGLPYFDLRLRLGQIQPPVDFIDVPNLAALVTALNLKRAPYALLYDTMLEDPGLRDGAPFGRLSLVREDVHFAAARANPRGQALVDRLYAAYRSLPPEQRAPERLDQPGRKAE